MKTRHEEVVALLKGSASVAEVAQRQGVSQAEVEAWRALYLDGLEAGARQRIPSRRGWVVGVALVAAFGGAGAMAANGLCPNGYPFCFTADSPALAVEVNHNFHQVKEWVEAKVGTVGNGNITSTGTTTLATTTLGNTTISGTSRLNAPFFTPPYSTWGIQQGAGGATIMNDNVTYQALMVVGNNSGGGARRVRLYDDVSVDANLSANGTLSVGNLRCRTTQTGCADSGGGNAHYLDRLDAYCNANEFMRGFDYQRCDGTTARFAFVCCQIGN